MSVATSERVPRRTYGVLLAVSQTGLARESFPATCPFTIAALFGEEEG